MLCRSRRVWRYARSPKPFHIILIIIIIIALRLREYIQLFRGETGLGWLLRLHGGIPQPMNHPIPITAAESHRHIAQILYELMSRSSSCSIPRSLEFLNHRFSCPAKIRLYTTQEVYDDSVLVCALQALPHSEQQWGHVYANLPFRSP